MSSRPWYVDERAHHLAIVHLTRRDDLVVRSAPEDERPGFLVTITSGGHHWRVFGVDLRAELAPFAAGAEHSLSDHERELFRDIPFPVIQLVFDVRRDDGRFRWIKEPVAGAEGAGLRLTRSGALRPFDRATLDEVVTAVSEWYERGR
ncbi:MAG TPA: hypothetical protein VHG91_10880 [Longimicrobium sp.]|nr:hypothetical protein [Longimicrobium sp.]